MKPLHDNVLIRKAEKKQSAGGILLVDNPSKDLVEGEVLAVGPGLYSSDGTAIRVTDHVNVGDRVLFKPYSAVNLPEADLVIVSYRDILSVL